MTRYASEVHELDAAHARACSAERHLLALISRAERAEVWRGSGARDFPHWLSMRYGISQWKAHRWVAAAHALESLPRLSRAFADGEVGVDKVVELCRFATAKTESDLIAWAQGVSTARVRRVADLEVRRSAEEVREAERSRTLTYWYHDEGRRFGMQVELPAAEGAVVVSALERVAAQLPERPGEEDEPYADARRADALVALCSARIASDDPDRASVVIHVSNDADANAEIENGGVIPPATVRRLACNARVQMVFEDAAGNPVRLGRMSREPSAWMLRQLRHRDGECRFPGCGSRRFTQAHHVVWWGSGGTTDLENLVLVCSFHHRLVHELGWSISRTPDGTVRWFTPGGVRYRAGPAAPQAALLRESVLAGSA